MKRMKTRLALVLFSLIFVSCVKKDVSSKDTDVQLIKKYLLIADSHEYNDVDSAIYYCKKALEISVQAKNIKEEIRSLNNLGFSLRNRGDLKEAYNVYSKALVLAENTKDTSFIARTYNSLGSYYVNLGDYDAALEYYLPAYEIRLKFKDTLGRATVAGNLGIVYSAINEYKLSEKYMLISLEINSSINDTIYMATDYRSLGGLYFKTNRVDEAFDAHTKSLDFYQRMGDKEGQFLEYASLGYMYQQQKEYTKAKSYFDRSMKLCQEMNFPSRRVQVHINFMEFYNEMEEYKLSLKHADSAMTLNTQYFNSKLERERIYASKIVSYKGLHEYEFAVNFLDKKDQLKDSLNTEKKINSLASSQVKLDVIEKETEIIKLENEQLLASEVKSRLFLALIGISAIGGFIVFRMRYVSLSRKRKHAEEKETLQRSFSQDIIRSIENERKRISRELHDSVGQSLLLIKNKVILGNTPKDTNIIDNTIQEVRDMALALHPYQFEQKGLVKSLENLMDEFQDTSKTLYTHDIDLETYDIESTKEIFIYRMIQEALNNVEKHAKAEVCALRITDNSKSVCFQIKDNGVGFDLSTGNNKMESLGMKTLKERATLIKAELVIESIVGEGTTIQITILK